MVTANHDSYRVEDSVDEIDRNGVRTVIEGKRIISYGLALLLETVQDWLAEVIPPRHNPHHP